MSLYSIKISRSKWKLIVWLPIIVGGVMFSVFTSSFFMPTEFVRASWFAAIGFLLVGFGFGLAYARMFKIEEIDK